MIKTQFIFLLIIALFGLPVVAQLDYPFPQMVPDQYMEPGFHRSVDAAAFPQAMRNARSTYSNMISNTDVNALFEQRTFTGSRVFQMENGSTQTLDYEIMYPPEDAVAPPGGFPLVFSTYGRTRLNEAMALDHFRANHPAYVVSFLHSERPGPLHSPPMYFDFALLFHEVFDHLFATYNIDENRVYGSGHSRGGSSMTILSHASPERKLITAAVPSAGGFQNMLGPIEDIAHIKWFSLQGADDSNSNPQGSEHAFDQLEKAGALDNVFWWIENTGHSPRSVGWNVADIVEWMFAQTKEDLARRPEAILQIDVTDGDVPVTLTADASDSAANNGGTITGYTWQVFKSREAIADYSNGYLHGYTLDTGFQGAPVIGTEDSVTFTIEEPGTWWLRVIVEDDEGNRRAATQEIHARSVVPTAAFTFSRNHEAAGTPIQFDASASEAEHASSLSSYSWDFGDGNTASGETVAHAFAAAGDYTVALTVTSSAGVTATVSQEVTVTEDFPGYRYFRFVGLTAHQTYNSPTLHHFAFRLGNHEFPAAPMTANVSQGITLDASWNAGNVWRVFDKNTGSGWSHHNYFTPGGWEMDVGEQQRFVPTGFDITMSSGNSRWTDFDLEASVDGVIWDTIWEQRFDAHGFLNTAGEQILFADVPFVQLHNVEDGGVFGLGTEFALQTELYNMTGVTGVEYFANGISLGTATVGPDYQLGWTPAELGEYTLTAKATYASGAKSQTTWFPLTVVIQAASVLSRIDISPEDIRVYPGSQVQMMAEAYDQYDIPLNPQPTINWSVSSGAGTIDATGLYSAGAQDGEFSLSASATVGENSVAAEQPVIVVDAGNFCAEYFAGEVLRPVWEFIRREPWPGARADVEQGRVTIQSRGQSMWQSTQQFSAIRRTDISGDFDVSVKLISQNANYSDDGSKAGILIANNFDDLSQGGYLALHTRGNRRVFVQHEGGTPGEINSGSSNSFPVEGDWPIWLRLVKSGTNFSTYYKFAEGDAWTHLGNVTLGAAAANSQVALFASSNNSTETLYGVFGDFIIADCDPGDFDLIPAAPEIVQQPQPVSTFEGRTVTLKAAATGYPTITGYQWLKDGVALANDARISGAQSPELVIGDAQLADQGAYTLAVTNDEGTSTSEVALVEVLPTPSLYLLIDFGSNHTDPGDEWNSLDNAATHTGLVNGIDGEETSVEIDMITTGGSGLQASGNDNAWGTRFISPDWANVEALNDRLFVDQGHTATLRFRNLDPAKTYRLEIASGFAGSGSNGNEPGLFQVIGASGGVEGFNAHNQQSLGTQVHWTSRGPTDGGNAPYALEGWMIWEDISPKAAGHIDVLLSTVSASTARVSINAARLIQLPEPVEQGPDIDQHPEGASLDAGQSHTFSVLASGAGTLTYQWFRDGIEIAEATEASLALASVGVGDAGSYMVQVSDENGSTMSNPAVLEVAGMELTLVTVPTAAAITYGQSLSEVVLSGGEVRNPADETVVGNFAFVDSDLEPSAGVGGYAVLFSPENDFHYQPLPLEVMVTVNPATATLFFSDLSQSYNSTELSPSVSTDPSGLSVAVTFPEPPVNVGIHAFTVEITDPNYTGSGNDTLTITAAPLEVTADNQVKGLYGPDPVFTWNLTGGELFGEDGLSGELTREAGESPGTYVIQQGTLTAGANYELSFIAGTLTIVEELEYTLSYHANGGSGPVPDSVTEASGTPVAVSFAPAPTREGFTFLGWKTDADAVLTDFPLGEAATITLEEDVTLYAHWLSPWVLQENFKALTLGNLHGQNGWSAQNHSLVVEDPVDSANQAFSFRPGGSNNSASKSLFEPVDDGDSATFFFRFLVPEDSSNFNQQIRFGNLDIFRIAFNHSHDSVFSIFYDGMGGGQSNVGIDQSIDRDTWYKVWVMLDGSTSRYEIYLEGGEYETPTRVTTADDHAEKYVYAERTNNTISSIEWIGWGGDAVLFDDVYLFPGGMSLDDPRPVEVAGNDFDFWMDAYAADLSESQRAPLANPSGDGISNLLKYALGLDPRIAADRTLLPQMTLEDVDGNTYLALQVQRNPDIEGTQMWVEYSEDLSNWVNDLENLVWVVDTEDELLVRSAHPVEGEKKRQFLRLKVVME